jgi:hypothetical protein
MASEPQVKGVAFRSVYASLGKLRGETVQRATLEAVSEEVRHGFTYRSIVPGGWYPIAQYRELFRAIRAATGETKELVFDIGRQCTRDDMSGIYSVIAKLISPQSLWSLSQRVFSSYYSVGTVKMSETRRGYSHAAWSNCKGFDENMWTEVLGSCVQLLEIGGAKDVRIRVLSGGRDGFDTMEAAAHWG